MTRILGTWSRPWCLRRPTSVTEPQPGDFFLARISGWTGLVVRALQWANGDASRWTHAGVLLPNGRVFEAEPGGAHTSPLSEYTGRPLRWSSGIIELTEEERALIVSGSLNRLGTPYGWPTYLYLALYRIGIRSAWIRDRVQSDGDMMCSQLVDDVYKTAGVHLFSDGRLPQDVTPGDLARLLDHPELVERLG